MYNLKEMTNREIDVLIAERIFGAKVTFLNQKHGWRIDYNTDKDECNDPVWTDFGVDGYRLKNYTENMNFVWEVVEKMFKDGWSINIVDSELIPEIIDCGGYDVKFSCKAGARGRFKSSGNALPRVVCVAALLSYGIEV
jgi:hypothetical protein